ncbi:Zn(2)-C6 fungal-type DNA-binding domain protein [Niveomyces insectorum RCEF 264]|uniref:Zn(2)-C6 fungal-type DNA-binding domain protein n=1 Tax=Niveomyces insectorum RCEF 264 TaxID=1081102 RepID=A0A167XAY4_9HYPO|nr:Zn(2)-C6 fungal-type DNA-binding domain protein [Niveomyces insectorum RCEF 264]
MGRLSRGCLRCRERRVRCDEGRPSCRRCLHRNEICEGYRDTASLIFRHETHKVIEHAQAAHTSPAYASLPSRAAAPVRSRSVDASLSSRRLSFASGHGSDYHTEDASALAPDEAAGVKMSNPRRWLKATALAQWRQPPVEDQAVDLFLDKYVLYPCNQTSSPGFLEHLPSMFKEVDNIHGRHALRWSVRAAAYADVSKGQDSDALARKALQCYGMALTALGESLARPGKEPDDYDLMTVVMLDMFETLYIPDEASKGAHGQGMAQILRLRGPDLVYSARGWSLFRLAHHRLQKQQLAFNMPPLAESTEWLDQLDTDTEPYVRLETITHEINETCKRARSLLELIDGGGLPVSALIGMIQELHALDQTAVNWRHTPHRAFATVAVSERPDLQAAADGITDTIQLHPDVWMAYGWNYHRTARILFLQQLLKCAYAALNASDLDVPEEVQTLTSTVDACISTVRWLADQILATVPQSFGDVDHMGRPHDSTSGPPRCRGIGGYLLLWPTRVVKGQPNATSQEQKERATRVFERIREYTGMKAILGDKSSI